MVCHHYLLLNIVLVTTQWCALSATLGGLRRFIFRRRLPLYSPNSPNLPGGERNKHPSATLTFRPLHARSPRPIPSGPLQNWRIAWLARHCSFGCWSAWSRESVPAWSSRVAVSASLVTS